jgi:hypothetical protein
MLIRARLVIMGTVATCALVALAGGAIAQPYPDSDPRSSQYQEYQRRESERRQGEEAADKKRAEESARIFGEGLQNFMDNQRKLQERLAGDVARDRAMFLQTPPIPPQKNLLLGQWKLDRTKKKPANALAEINAALSQPACEMVFGDGIWDFRPKALYGIDAGFGETKLTDVDYRGNEGLLGVIPKQGKLFVFKILGPDRMQELTSTRIGADPCNFVRVGPSAQAASAQPVNTATSKSAGAPSRGQAAPATQMAAAAPPRSTLARPSPEVCRNTLLDQLGKVGVNQVRAMSDVRFKEAAIEGKVPNSNNLRIDLRGSACDDPRLRATLYDFDANGMLQSITYVWARPAGPAPAPIFQERVATLSRFHALPPPQSPGRLQGATALGRLVLQDMPERNLLLEAYAASQ